MTLTSTTSGHSLSGLLPRELVEELLHLARAAGADFAEVFAEYTVHTGFQLEERRLRTSSYQVSQGVGVRAIAGEIDLNPMLEAIHRACPQATFVALTDDAAGSLPLPSSPSVWRSTMYSPSGPSVGPSSGESCADMLTHPACPVAAEQPSGWLQASPESQL